MRIYSSTHKQGVDLLEAIQALTKDAFGASRRRARALGLIDDWWAQFSALCAEEAASGLRILGDGPNGERGASYLYEFGVPHTAAEFSMPELNASEPPEGSDQITTAAWHSCRRILGIE